MTKNKTAQYANESVTQCKALMRSAGIGYDEWVALLFELGCAFCEQYAPKGWAVPLLENAELHYWDWWTVQWVDDDKVLQLASYSLKGEKEYERLKWELFYRREMREEFGYFLNRDYEKV
jgi:hypothetical protein